MRTISGVYRKHLQYVYAGLQKSLQQEWEFVQRVIPDIEDAFGPVETSLRDAFLPALFQGVGELTLGRGVTRLRVKQAGLDIPDPTKTAPENWMTSCVITGHLVAVLRV